LDVLDVYEKLAVKLAAFISIFDHKTAQSHKSKYLIREQNFKFKVKRQKIENFLKSVKN
jgi:hypothetical protein